MNRAFFHSPVEWVRVPRRARSWWAPSFLLPPFPPRAPPISGPFRFQPWNRLSNYTRIDRWVARFPLASYSTEKPPLAEAVLGISDLSRILPWALHFSSLPVSTPNVVPLPMLCQGMEVSSFGTEEVSTTCFFPPPLAPVLHPRVLRPSQRGIRPNGFDLFFKFRKSPEVSATSFLSAFLLSRLPHHSRRLHRD